MALQQLMQIAIRIHFNDGLAGLQWYWPYTYFNVTPASTIPAGLCLAVATVLSYRVPSRQGGRCQGARGSNL